MTIEDDDNLSPKIDALAKMTVTDLDSGEVLTLRQYVMLVPNLGKSINNG